MQGVSANKLIPYSYYGGPEKANSIIILQDNCQRILAHRLIMGVHTWAASFALVALVPTLALILALLLAFVLALVPTLVLALVIAILALVVANALHFVLIHAFALALVLALAVEHVKLDLVAHAKRLE